MLKPQLDCNCFLSIADVRVRTTTQSPLTYLPRINSTYTSASNTTQSPPGDISTGVFNSSEASMMASMSSTSSIPLNSSHVPQWTHTGPHTRMNSTVESPPLATRCCKKCLIFILRLHSFPTSIPVS